MRSDKKVVRGSALFNSCGRGGGARFYFLFPIFLFFFPFSVFRFSLFGDKTPHFCKTQNRSFYLFGGFFLPGYPIVKCNGFFATSHLFCAAAAVLLLLFVVGGEV